MALFSSPAKTTLLPRFAPAQMGLMGSLNRSALDVLKGLGGQDAQFGPLAQKTQTEFQQKTVPSILERLTQMGGLSSSSLAGSLGEAGVQLGENLAAQEQQFNQQNRAQQIQLLSMLLSGALQPQYETMYQPEQLNFLGQLVGSGLQAIPSIAGLALGGPVGGAAGGALGGLLSGGFNALATGGGRPSSPMMFGQGQMPRALMQMGGGSVTPAGLTAGATA